MGAAINLGFNLIGIFLLFLIAGLDPRWSWLLLPVVLVLLIVLTTTLSMLLAVAFVRYRDVGEGWPLIVRALFYATPILYPISILPGQDADDARREPALRPCSPGLRSG